MDLAYPCCKCPIYQPPAPSGGFMSRPVLSSVTVQIFTAMPRSGHWTVRVSRPSSITLISSIVTPLLIKLEGLMNAVHLKSESITAQHGLYCACIRLAAFTRWLSASNVHPLCPAPPDTSLFVPLFLSRHPPFLAGRRFVSCLGQ